MPTLRVSKVSVAGSAAGPKLRVSKVSVAGTLATAPKLRVSKISVGGTTSVVLNPIANKVDVEPGSTVSLTAVPSSGSPTPDTYTWRRISGPAISFVGTAATVTFIAPSVMPPNSTTVVVGVTASVDGTASAERQVSITVLPQLIWTRQGNAWVGSQIMPM